MKIFKRILLALLVVAVVLVVGYFIYTGKQL